jgi:parvulin-like peptidyl-prolyl isomerase
MKLARVILAILGSALVLVVAACGGEEDVPANAVAVVDGKAIPRSELDELVARAKNGYEAQQQEFPKVGTPEYQSLQSQYVKYLVQLEEFEMEADELGIEISDKDIDEEVEELVKTRFDGDRKKLDKALEQQGFTMKALRESFRVSVLNQKIFDGVTKDVKVTRDEILAYYQENQSNYGTPESRDVRHILVAVKDGDKVDFAKSKEKADDLYAQLQDGADFVALAKQHSDDPGTRATGGRYTAVRGAVVPEFEQASFELKVNEISKPVKTTYGYHIIQALAPAKKAKVTPLEKVQASIKASLLQQKRSEFMENWLEELEDRYESKVSYAAGFEPPELPETTETETETEPATD